MDAGDWIALGSFVVALGAGIVAALSVREARRSADAAKHSALADKPAVEIAAQAEEARQAPRLDGVDIEPVRDGAVARAVEILGEDPAHPTFGG